MEVGPRINVFSAAEIEKAELYRSIIRLGVVHIDTKGIIVNRMSTGALAFKRDTRLEYLSTLINRVNRDIHRAVSVFDLNNITALKYIGADWWISDSTRHTYLVFALFLFLTVLNAAHPNQAGDNGEHLTLLGAMRRHKFYVKNSIVGGMPDDQRQRELFLDKMYTILDDLGLAQYKPIIQKYYTDGTFEVSGEKQCVDLYQPKDASAPANVHGSFVRIVEMISKGSDGNALIAQFQDVILFSTAFSEYASLLLAADLSRHDNLVAQFEILLQHPGALQSLILSAQEHICREMLRKINEETKALPDDASAGDKEAALLIKVGKYIPFKVLQHIKENEYLMIFSTEKSVANITPENYTPRAAGETLEDFMGSRGTRLPKYRAFFISEGKDPKPEFFISQGKDPEAPEKLKFTDEENTIRYAQSFLHEFWHEISWDAIQCFNSFPRKEYEAIPYVKLWDLVNKLHYEIEEGRFPEFANIIPFTTAGTFNYKISENKEANLADLLNWNSKYYQGYPNSAAMTEEVLANMFSLINTEFSKDRVIENNPFYSTDPRYSTIVEITRLLDDTLAKIGPQSDNNMVLRG